MDTLARLTEEAKLAAAAYVTLERQTVEARREQALIYGRALREIRKEIPSKNAFSKYLTANGLAVYSAGWRSDAMWLAEQVDDLRKDVSHCPESNPTNIRKWDRRQDPDYQPKKKSTKAGIGKAAQDVGDHVREAVEKGEPLNVAQVGEETGYSRIVVESGIAYERGRLEGLKEAPVDVLAVAEAIGLNEKSKAKLEALEKRLRMQNEAEFDSRVSAAVRKHIDEYVLPEYNKLLTEADERLASYKPPLSFAEYNTLIWALHEDQTDVARRAGAFDMVMRLRIVLRGAEKEELKPRTLPTSFAEMMARRRKAA